MFAIFYLETVCMTKKTASKQADDKWLGHTINIFITSFYFILFFLLLFCGMIKYNADDAASGVPGVTGGIGMEPNYFTKPA